ncbi:general substrate transporter [Dipodascopsis uninucleata]
MAVLNEKENTEFFENIGEEDRHKIANDTDQSDHEETILEVLRRYPIACISIFVLLWGQVLVGYDTQAGGLVIGIPEFRKDFGYLYQGSYVLYGKWQSAFSGGPLAALVVGAVTGTFVSDKIGRKFTILIGLCITVAAVAVEFTATTNERFFAGKFVNGYGLGIIKSVTVTYIAEISPLAIRGKTTGASNLSLCIGPLVCTILSNSLGTRSDKWAYRGIFASQWLFSGVGLMLLPFLPESPWYYSNKGQDTKAKKSLQRLYGEKYMLSDVRLAWIKRSQEEMDMQKEGSSFLACFKGTNLRRTIITVMALTIQKLSGVDFISNYSTYYFQLAGFTTQKSFQLSCGAQGLSVAGTLTAMIIGDRLGRRRLLLSGLTIMMTLLAITGGLSTRSDDKGMITGASACIVMYNFFYNFGLGAVAYSVIAETPAPHLRSKTIGLAIGTVNVLGCMWLFVLPFIFNPDKANLKGKTAFIYFGLDVFCLTYLYFYQTETANRSFREIDEMFDKHVRARDFATFETDYLRAQRDATTK